MKLRLVRELKKNNCTIGSLFIDDEFFCNTLEDLDRGLFETTPLHQIKKIKVKHKTAIPYGSYEVVLNVKSPRFGNVEFYKKNANGGKLPRLLDIPGFEGVLIHCGNTAEDSSGCILVGEYKEGECITNSKKTFIKLYSKLLEAKKKEEKITIEII